MPFITAVLMVGSGVPVGRCAGRVGRGRSARALATTIGTVEGVDLVVVGNEVSDARGRCGGRSDAGFISNLFVNSTTIDVAGGLIMAFGFGRVVGVVCVSGECAGYRSRNATAARANSSWYWNTPPCPESG